MTLALVRSLWWHILFTPLHPEPPPIPPPTSYEVPPPAFCGVGMCAA